MGLIDEYDSIDGALENRMHAQHIAQLEDHLAVGAALDADLNRAGVGAQMEIDVRAEPGRLRYLMQPVEGEPMVVARAVIPAFGEEAEDLLDRPTLDEHLRRGAEELRPQAIPIAQAEIHVTGDDAYVEALRNILQRLAHNPGPANNSS